MNESPPSAKFPADAVTKLVSNLIYEKGSDEQYKFLSCVLESTGEEFATFVEDNLKGSIASNKAYEGDPNDLPSVTGLIDLTAGHMDMVPVEDSLILYSAWKLTRQDAALPGVWGAITLKAIRDGSIREPSWLLIEPGQNQPDQAKSNLADLLQRNEENEKTKKGIDRHIRRVLRTLMGPRQIRGRPTLYTDCPLARAWWIGALSEDIRRVFEEQEIAEQIDQKQIAEALVCQWRTLSDVATAKLTTLIDRDILAGIVLAVADSHHTEEFRLTTKSMDRICRSLGEETAGRILSADTAKNIASTAIQHSV